MWGAGHRVREILEEHGLFSTTTQRGVSPTFFGARGNSSTIDHVILPRALAAKVKSQGPSKHMGRRLQYIPDAQLRDHALVHARVETDMDFQKKQQTAWSAPNGEQYVSVNWDGDKLTQALRGSHERHNFLTAVEE
eukprot:3372048-Pyramimonas_sp.AAC.1